MISSFSCARQTHTVTLARPLALILIVVSATSNLALAQNLVLPPNSAPPAIPTVRQEVITQEISPGHVWIPGYWERVGNQWSWVGGSWKEPPHQTAHWVNGYWKLQSNGYQWQPGHWGVVSTGLVVQKPIALPAAVPESVPPVPSTGGSWIPGRWEWQAGHWVWIAGYYIQPPIRQAKWVTGHWAKGAIGFWRWLPGHWER